MEGILAITFIFGGGTAFLLAISPVGRAVADRIRGGAIVGDETIHRLEASHQEVLDELDTVRRELMDLQERMDFSERVLAQNRQSALPPADGA